MRHYFEISGSRGAGLKAKPGYTMTPGIEAAARHVARQLGLEALSVCQSWRSFGGTQQCHQVTLGRGGDVRKNRLATTEGSVWITTHAGA